MYDIVSIGDILTNYVYVGTSSDQISTFERHPAGATSNLLSQCARLGGKVALISTIGDDTDGLYLYNYIKGEGFDVSRVRIASDLCTRSVFVFFSSDNDRYFCYNNSHITQYETALEEGDVDLVKKSRVLNYPLSYLETDKPIRKTTTALIEVAQKHEILTAIDANYRGQRFSEEMRLAKRNALLDADIIKVTTEELRYFFGEGDPGKAAYQIFTQGRPRLLAVTMDRGGSLLFTRDNRAYSPGYAVQPVDTTGAGDSYFGALLYQLTRPG